MPRKTYPHAEPLIPSLSRDAARRTGMQPATGRTSRTATRMPPRVAYVLATKAYFPMGGGDRGLSRDQIRKQLDASLKRLGVDYVDLYQCHRYDSETPLEETMQALTEAVRQGKSRYIGFSEWSAPQIEAAFVVAGVERFVSSQPQYSLLWRQPEETVIPLCAAKDISQIVW